MIATKAPSPTGPTRAPKQGRVRGTWLAALLLMIGAFVGGIMLPASAASRSGAFVGGIMLPASAASRSVAFVVVPTQSVMPGGTVRFPFALRTTGRVGTVAFSVSGAPAGSATTVEPLGSGNYSLVVAVPAAASPGSSTITVRTKSLATSKSLVVRVTVEAAAIQPTPPTTTPPTTPTTIPPTTPPTTPTSNLVFNLRADNPELTVRTGQTAAFGFTVDRTGGNAGGVTFTAAGLPGGVTANFSPNPTSGGTVLYATAAAGVPEGRYVVTISASSGAQIVKTVSVGFTVSNPLDFALIVPATTNILLGGTTSVSIGYQIVGVSAPSVSLGVAGLPAGASFSFTPNPTTGNSTLTFSTSAATLPGSYPLTIVGASGTNSHSYPMTLNVISSTTGATPIGGFGLSATPFSLGVSRGSSAAYSVVVTPTGGFNSAISFALPGLPSGVSVSVNGSLPNFSLLVTVPATTPPGRYPLVLTATSGTLSAAVTLELNVF